jgi:hypothetical protein
MGRDDSDDPNPEAEAAEIVGLLAVGRRIWPVIWTQETRSPTEQVVA